MKSWFCWGVLVLIFVVAALSLHSCTPHKPFRTPGGFISTSLADLATDGAHRTEVEKHSVEIFPEFRLGFVEFDDQGDFWSRAQMAQVEKMVLADGAEDGTQGVLIVTFVHGWKHNSEVCDENVACFREILKSLYNLERLSATQNGVSPRRIAGVYVGWRGKSITSPVLKELSFYARKNMAHRVGRGETLELFTRLEMLRDRALRSGGARSKLIVVGHSFGGAVVYSAVSQLHQERLIRSQQTAAQDGNGDGTALVPGFGDLVLLVNPAFEASLYNGIHDVARARPQYSQRQPALLFVASSETDQATRVWFPIGRFFSTLFQRTSSPLQKKELTTTLGNFEPFRTHQMAKAPAAVRGGLLPDIREFTPGQARGDSGCLCRYLDVTVLSEGEIEALAGIPGEGTPPPVRNADGDEVFGGVVLKPVRGSVPFNPFIVAQTTDEIITQHNGIYNRLFIDFLRSFLLEMEKRTAGTTEENGSQ